MCLSESSLCPREVLCGDSHTSSLRPASPRFRYLLELTPVYVGPAVAEEFKRIVRDSEITK